MLRLSNRHSISSKVHSKKYLRCLRKFAVQTAMASFAAGTLLFIVLLLSDKSRLAAGAVFAAIAFLANSSLLALLVASLFKNPHEQDYILGKFLPCWQIFCPHGFIYH